MGESRRRGGLAGVLARRRVLLGFVFGAVALWLAHPTPRTLVIGAAIAAIGEALRIWAAGHLEKGREVTSSGPYRFTRHPLYLGSTIMGIGLAIASSSLVVGAIVIAYLIVTLTAAMRTEEAQLTARFGRAYTEYRDGGARGADRRFSARRAVMNREYRALTGLAAVLALLIWKTL